MRIRDNGDKLGREWGIRWGETRRNWPVRAGGGEWDGRDPRITHRAQLGSSEPVGKRIPGSARGKRTEEWICTGNSRKIKNIFGAM